MSDLTEAELLQRIEGLLPMIEAHAAEAERQRKPVDAVMRAISDTGIYRYFVPKRFGGLEFGMQTFIRIGIALGGACASTAWVTTFCMEHNWLLGLYGREAQEDIFGKQPWIIAPGALAPRGTATPVDGGYQLTGRWEWGTGVMHADWVMVGAIVPASGSTPPQFGMFILPIADAEVIDTWQVAGMAGTGSNDIAVNDRFVPAHRVVDLAKLRTGGAPGAAWHDRPMYRMPMLPVLGLTALSPAVGVAKRAVALFRDRMKERTVYGTSDKQGEKAVAQHRLGRLSVAAKNVEILIHQLAAEVEDWGHATTPCPEAVRAEYRIRLGDLMRQSRDIVRDVVEASGAHVHFLGNPLQRMHRDIHTMSCHTVFDVDIGAEQHGRILLGLPPSAPV